MSDTELLPITLIDVNPANSVVSTPDGRVFVDMTKMLTDATMQLAMETILVNPSDVEARAICTGKARILKTLLYAQEGLVAAVGLQKDGIEVSKENVEARVAQDRLRAEKEFEAKTGKSVNDASPLDFL